VAECATRAVIDGMETPVPFQDDGQRPDGLSSRPPTRACAASSPAGSDADNAFVVDLRQSPFVDPVTLAARLRFHASATSTTQELLTTAATTLLGLIGGEVPDDDGAASAEASDAIAGFVGLRDAEDNSSVATAAYLARFKATLTVMRKYHTARCTIQVFDNADAYLVGADLVDPAGLHARILDIFLNHLRDTLASRVIVVTCTPTFLLTLGTSSAAWGLFRPVVIGDLDADEARRCFSQMGGSDEHYASLGMPAGGRIADIVDAARLSLAARLCALELGGGGTAPPRQLQDPGWASLCRFVDGVLDPRASSGTLVRPPVRAAMWAPCEARAVIERLVALGADGALPWRHAVRTIAAAAAVSSCAPTILSSDAQPPSPSSSSTSHHRVSCGADGDDNGGGDWDDREAIGARLAHAHAVLRALCAHGALVHFPVAPEGPMIDFVTLGSPKLFCAFKDRFDQDRGVASGRAA
jgi:hypothetical protein